MRYVRTLRRFFQYRDIKALWNLQGDFSGFFPRYNIAPSQDVPLIVRNHGRNELKPMRWGLVPSWAPDPSMGTTHDQRSCRDAARKAVFQRACFKTTVSRSG
jgi:putative SOS response-associated peptidase YedK